MHDYKDASCEFYTQSTCLLLHGFLDPISAVLLASFVWFPKGKTVMMPNPGRDDTKCFWR
jgi:hypothetical protein